MPVSLKDATPQGKTRGINSEISFSSGVLDLNLHVMCLYAFTPVYISSTNDILLLVMMLNRKFSTAYGSRPSSGWLVRWSDLDVGFCSS